MQLIFISKSSDSGRGKSNQQSRNVDALCNADCNRSRVKRRLRDLGYSIGKIVYRLGE